MPRPNRPPDASFPARHLGSLAGFLAIALGADYPDAAHLPARPELPDPLIAFDGTRVTTKDQWVTQRRPELKALFEHYMYGTAPPAPATVVTKVDREDRASFGGKATTKEVTIDFGPPGTPKIHLLIVAPDARNGRGKAPVFVGLNFYGNHAVLKDPAVALPTGWVPARSPGAKNERATDAGRGAQLDVWRAEELVARGYALATFYCGDIAPDHPGRADGVFPHYPGYDWGAIAAWAWGLSRAADYLATDPDIDAKRMAVIGHSRLGKAALLAGAFDERFAVVISHQAGCGGSAPSRGTVGETVAQINKNFPHWFNAAFKTFNDHPDKLPFDQNCLAALVAPRPLLFTNATEDTHANPEGQFQVLKAAEPAYKLLGAGGLGAESVPETGKLVATTLDGSLGLAVLPRICGQAPGPLTASRGTIHLDATVFTRSHAPAWECRSRRSASSCAANCGRGASRTAFPRRP